MFGCFYYMYFVCLINYRNHKKKKINIGETKKVEKARIVFGRMAKINFF